MEDVLGEENANDRFADVDFKGVDPYQTLYNVVTLGGIISW